MATRNRVKIGRYAINASPITVYGVEGSDGSGYTGWNAEGYCTITIGFDCEWAKAQEIMLHELMEFSMLIHGYGLVPFRFLHRKDSERYHYSMTHEQFTEVVQSVSDVMQYLIPDLSKAHRKWHGKK